MGFTTELLLTVKQLKGFGRKTILDMSKDNDFSTMEQLCDYWKQLKGKKFVSISRDDLMAANRTARNIMNACEREGIGILSYYEPLFPQLLRECVDENGNLDQPIFLFYRGDISILQKPGIAVIGTREPTPNGVKAGLYFSGEFAKSGYNIVSGLAVGCDTTGHRGALDTGGVTTAFLGTGLGWNEIYPRENLELAREIVEKGGLLLSEYFMGESIGKFGLVARDRLQAGLSVATVVIQTGVKGGTLHAVNATLQSGKPLVMVSYKSRDDNENSKVEGNLHYIRTGQAKELTSQSLPTVLESLKRSAANVGKVVVQTSIF